MVNPRLRYSIMALGVVQAGNFLVPLFVLPYLARVLGAEVYGQMVWVQTIMLFGVIWVDFGFGWSATREISSHRGDSVRIDRLFSNVWAVQWSLAVIFVLGSIFFVGYLDKDGSQLSLYIAGLGMVLGQVLLPIWLFQGLEALREVAVIQLMSKLLVFPLIFLLVNGPQDVIVALAIFSLSTLLAGVLSLVWIYQRRLINWVHPDFCGMRSALRDGALLFSSRALISFYTTLVPLAVGYWAGSVQLAYFNLADKLRTVVQALFAPVSQAVFPRMSWLFQQDTSAAYALIRKLALGMGVASGFGCCVLWVGAADLMALLGGDEFLHGAPILRWLAFVPLVVILSNVMGVQIMLPQKMNKPFTVILALASLVSFLALYPAVKFGGAIGAAKVVLAVECLVTVLMAIYLWRVMNFEKV
jgi:O-antigen/teichoic acid export membrane protein